MTNRYVESYIRSVRFQFEDWLAQMVETPSVSSDPEHVQDIHQTATLVMHYLNHVGAEARLITTRGYPTVSGGWHVDTRYPTLTMGLISTSHITLVVY